MVRDTPQDVRDAPQDLVVLLKRKSGELGIAGLVLADRVL